MERYPTLNECAKGDHNGHYNGEAAMWESEKYAG